MATNRRFTVESAHRNCAIVRYEFTNLNDEFWCLLRADAHHDNPHCDQELEAKHLKQAVDRGAGVIDAGDLFCAMQGKYDKRSSKSDIRPEHCDGNYLDKLVSTAADFYEPYAGNIISIGRGNHETAISNRHETDLTDRLVSEIRRREGKKSQICAGGYAGWIRFNFKQATSFYSASLYYHHGWGGGGPVTRGVIQTNRMSVQAEADVMLSGHSHDTWVVPIQRQRLTDRGIPYQTTQWHCRPGGYKDSWGDGHSGWEVEKSLGPKRLGGVWLKFFIDKKRHIQAHAQITE